MSTEQQTPPAAPAQPPAPAAGAKPLGAQEPKGEANALAAAIGGAWDRFKQGKLLSYSTMALLLVVTAAVGVGWWIVFERRKGESAKWVALDTTTGIKGLEEFAGANPNTIQARLASLEIARTQLGPEGIDQLANVAGRKSAVESIEKAREAFGKLLDEFKSDPVIRVQCLVALAKAESALVGMPKEGTLSEFRGDPKRAIELLDQVADAAGETPWGKDAKKLADVLRNQNTQEQLQTLQRSLYDATPKLPGTPDLGPIAPKMP